MLRLANTATPHPKRTPIASGTPTERMMAVQRALLTLNPNNALSADEKNKLSQHPLPHTLAYKALYEEFMRHRHERHTETLAATWESRLQDYLHTVYPTYDWPVRTINPATIEPGSDDARLLGEFIHSIQNDDRINCIYPIVNIPFLGFKLALTHVLIPRLKSKGMRCVDVAELQALDEGHFGNINEIVKVLQFNDQHELISNTPPKHERVYKLSKSKATLFPEFQRSQSVPYLRVKNHRDKLFSMRKLDGVNLASHIETFNTMSREARFEAWLMLASQGYKALDEFVAKNGTLQCRHGDVKATNMIVQPLENGITIKLIDFDPDGFTPFYYPHKAINRELPRKPMHDVYAFGRVLAQAMGDKHDIWCTSDLDVFMDFVQSPADELLCYVFQQLDELVTHALAPASLIDSLKQTLRNIDRLSSKDYPSAESLKVYFEGVNLDYQTFKSESAKHGPRPASMG